MASDLIRSATAATYSAWSARYGSLPPERLRTEIGIAAVRSTNPGFCYKAAGYEPDRVVRGKLYLWAPLPTKAECAAVKPLCNAIADALDEGELPMPGGSSRLGGERKSERQREFEGRAPERTRGETEAHVAEALCLVGGAS